MDFFHSHGFFGILMVFRLGLSPFLRQRLVERLRLEEEMLR